MTQAHLEIIKKLSTTFSDAEIRVVPVYKHPDTKTLASYADRLAMTKQVMHNCQAKGLLTNVRVSDIEKTVYNAMKDETALEWLCNTLDKPFISYESACDVTIDKQTYYQQELTHQLQSLRMQNKTLYEECKNKLEQLGLRTLRLLTYLKACEPDTDFSLALGADTLNALLSGNWFKGDLVIKECAEVIYFTRAELAIPVIQSPISAIQKAIDGKPCKFTHLEVFQEHNARFKNASSTRFRELRDEPEQLSNTVPMEVMKYAYLKKLYGFSDDFYDRATVLAWYKLSHKVDTLSLDDESKIEAEMRRRKTAQSKAIPYVALN